MFWRLHADAEVCRRKWPMVFIPSNTLVGSVGRLVWRVFKKVPILFLLCCIIGLTVGVVVLFCPATGAREAIFLRIIGVACLLFYGGLAVLFVVKIRRGTWQRFCDWSYGIFANM
jgi:hypothetical protein